MSCQLLLAKIKIMGDQLSYLLGCWGASLWLPKPFNRIGRPNGRVPVTSSLEKLSVRYGTILTSLHSPTQEVIGLSISYEIKRPRWQVIPTGVIELGFLCGERGFRSSVLMLFFWGEHGDPDRLTTFVPLRITGTSTGNGY